MGELLEKYNAALQADQAPSPFKKPGLLPAKPIRSAATVSLDFEKHHAPIAKPPARGVRRIRYESILAPSPMLADSW